MSKYTPLRDHLAACTQTELILSFADIERLVGPLPTYAERPQFWANLTGAAAPGQRKACRDAGRDTFLLAGLNKVRFVKVAGRRISPSTPAPTAPLQTARAKKPPLTTQALIAGGFELASRWMLASDDRLALDPPLPVTPGVYAFVREGVALYVGIAASGLRNRLGFYIRPGTTQHTSQRLNAKIKAELAAGFTIEIFVAAPPTTTWNSWELDIGPSLEASLIRRYDVSWNLRGT